jgi:hypothetical protein
MWPAVSLALILSACGHASAPPETSAPVTTTPATIAVSLVPVAATVPAGGSLVFTATVVGAGTASSAVTFSVDGTSGGNTTVGAIVTTASSATSTTALYTAPLAPTPASVTVTATSVADSSKSASATVTIACATTNSISPAAVTVALGQTQSFTASFCGVSGATIVWDVNGVANGDIALGTIATTSTNTALYTAPADLPTTNPLTIDATASSASGGSVTVAASLTLVSTVSISISPPSATLAPGQRATFSATVSNTSDIGIAWFVNGIANGSSSIGQICRVGTNPCVPPSVSVVGAVDYVAPASVPANNLIALTVVSHADSSRSASAIVSIVASSGAVSVSVSPPYVFVLPSQGSPSTQQFFATVAGTTNTSVTWSVQSAVAGAGCAGAACGSVNATGIYSAPALAPSPNAIAVVATSQADPTRSASATVALTSGPVIETVLPSSVMAGAVQSFPLSVRGANFVAGSGSSASVILLQGAVRATTCASVAVCTTALNPTDVQSASTLTIQVENPGSPGKLSNPVPFVIVPFDVSQGSIALSEAQPTAAGEDVIVVEPSNAAASSPLNVDSVGYLTGGNTCGIQGSPLVVTRPPSGSAVASICIHGTGLDPTFTYAFTAPESSASDIGVVASAVPGSLPNVIELDLQISSATLPGVRSLFVTTLNDDRAVASGVLEVK